jgi:hypothetical protein
MKLRMPEACFPGIGIKYSSVIPSKQLIRRKISNILERLMALKPVAEQGRIISEK